MENGYNLSDIAAVSGGMGGLGAGGGGAWVLIILFAMIFGNGGFGGWGNGAAALTQGDLQRAIDLNSVQEGQRNIEARVQEVGAESVSAIKDAAYNNLSEIRHRRDRERRLCRTAEMLLRNPACHRQRELQRCNQHRICQCKYHRADPENSRCACAKQDRVASGQNQSA